jgi:hypothetical protein
MRTALGRAGAYLEAGDVGKLAEATRHAEQLAFAVQVTVAARLGDE